MTDNEIANYINLGLLIIALTSTFAPIIVTIINNIHDTNIKKLEINSKIKQEILSNFAASINYLNGDFTLGAEFYKNLNLLNIYFDFNNEAITNIANTSYSDVLDFQEDVTELMKDLSKQIKNK